jgi:signal transduction histidine kinase
MAWCGVALFPAFGLLDYLVVESWQLFLTVRFSGTILLIAALLLTRSFFVSSNVIAHVSAQMIIQILMWMLSQMQTPEQFFIYSLNTSTAYIASAIFLLWHPRNSVFLALSTILGFVFFCGSFSSLSFGQIIGSGTLPLLTIVIMSQLFVHYRYKSAHRDFLIQADLNDANLKLKLKNIEIHDQNTEILKQKHNLEDLNDLKDRLLMIISHDFRSPLQSLKGLILLINDSDRITPEEFRMMVKGLKHKVDKTYDFLEGLLLWSKSQMKGFKVKQQPLMPHSLVEDSMALLQSFAEGKSITILNKTDLQHQAYGDEDMVRLIIRNLMANAIKFTDHGGTIQIVSYDENNKINIAVTDNGVGMEQAELDQLFNSTNPFHKNGTKLEKGTGLGLMLCKDFVEKNNGKLSVSSIPGQGTTISFSISKNEVIQNEAVDNFSFPGLGLNE